MGQREEIETIRERNITIKLSDADVKRICKKAGGVGLTVSELLESFIGDLVDGTYTNGSDERMHANEWFERCGFGMFPDKTFVRYLIEWDQLDEVLNLWDDIKTGKEELEYSETHQDEFTEEEIAGWKEDIEYWQEQLDDIFKDFKKWMKDEATGTLEEEINKVFEWQREYEQIKGEGENE